MNKFVKWLDNYWYHYKWPTLIVGFLLIAVSIMTFQYFTRDVFDLSIVYAGPYDPTPNQTREIETELGKLIENDFNGDNKKNCQLNDFFLMTDEQYEQKRKEYDARGEYYYVNPQNLANNRQQFSNQVFAGESIVCLLDPAWYEVLLEQKAFVPLAEVLDEVPDYARDEYCVRLCDTPFAKYFTAMQPFPEDTVLCLRTLSTATAFKNKDEAEKVYEFNKRFFVSLFEFEIE